MCNQRLTSAGAQPKLGNVRMRSGVSNDTASSKGVSNKLGNVSNDTASVLLVLTVDA